MLKRLLLIGALLLAPAQALAVGYTWNNANWFDPSAWTLSLANKKATRASPSGNIAIKTNEGFSSGVVIEKLAYRTWDGNQGIGSGAVGIVNGAWTSTNTTLGNDANSLRLKDDGTGKYNNAGIPSGYRLPGDIPFPGTVTIWIKVDYTAKTVAFSYDGLTYGNATDITAMIAANSTLYFTTYGYDAGQVVELQEPAVGGSSGSLLLLGVGDQ